MDKEVAKLVITTGSFTTTVQRYGYRTTNWNFVYVTNLDLRQILGETIYDNHDKFMVNIMPYGNLASTELTTATLTGMNLINSTAQGKQAGGAVPILGMLNSYSILTGEIYSRRNYIMIKPTDTNLNLTFQVTANDGALATLSFWTFLFTFTPIKDIIYKNPYNYLHTLEQANFALSTQILTAGSTTQYGTMNANKNLFTFANINMRQIIGSLWNKYDKFNLIVNTLSVMPLSSTTTNQRRILYQMSGLQFINSLALTNPAQMPLTTTSFTPIFQTNGQNVVNGDIVDNPCNITTFRKPESENVSLTFQIYSAATSAINSSAFADSFFTFSVVGVKNNV
jgi:hypothetical protein